MDLKQLWKQRRTGFWNEILPYLGYVIQSGVAMVFLFLVIAFSAWYTSFVQNIPAEFPIRWIALLLLAPLVMFSSYRTYLLPADIVFLRPQEYRMQEYLKNSFARGIIYKSLGLLLVFVTLWPSMSEQIWMHGHLAGSSYSCCCGKGCPVMEHGKS